MREVDFVGAVVQLGHDLHPRRRKRGSFKGFTRVPLKGSTVALEGYKGSFEGFLLRTIWFHTGSCKWLFDFGAVKNVFRVSPL